MITSKINLDDNPRLVYFRFYRLDRGTSSFRFTLKPLTSIVRLFSNWTTSSSTMHTSQSHCEKYERLK